MKRRFRPALLAALTLTLSSAAVAGQPNPPAAQSSAAVEIALPAEAGTGSGKEVKHLVDNPQLSLATIILRKGTLLPEHSSSSPVTIMALQGGGIATVSGKKIRLDAGRMVFLPANAPHAVQPDAGTDLILLVHHLKGTGAAEAPYADHHKGHAKEGAKP